MSNIPNNRRLALLAGCAVVALALPLAPGAIEPAQAASCGLSEDDNNATIDTVGGANSGGNDVRLACGLFAMATGANSTAVGAGATRRASTRPPSAPAPKPPPPPPPHSEFQPALPALTQLP
jgi:hypothetical protein